MRNFFSSGADPARKGAGGVTVPWAIVAFFVSSFFLFSSAFAFTGNFTTSEVTPNTSVGADITQSATPATPQGNVVAVAQQNTITISGTIEAGDVFTATLPVAGIVSYTAQSGDDADAVAAGLQAAIAAVEEGEVFSSGVTGSVIALVADTAGTGFVQTSSTTDGGADGTQLATTATPQGNVVAVAQQNTITISGTIEAGDVFTATLPVAGIVSYTAQSGDDADAVATGLNDAIQASTDYALQAFESTVATNVITLDAKVAGTGFTTTSSATNFAGVAQVTDFVPTAPTVGETFRLAINSNPLLTWDYEVLAPATVQEVVDAFVATINADVDNTVVTCTNNGNTKIRCTADTAGTAFTPEATIVDITSPTAEISYSDADGIVKAGDSLTITATFNEAMADAPIVNIALSGSNTQTAVAMIKTDATHYTYTHTVAVGDGATTVALSLGTDVAGNVIVGAPTAGATFTVDNTAPTISIINPTTTPEQSKTITASESDGILTMAINNAGVDTCDGTLTFSAYASTTFSAEADNGKKICYRATDSAGNIFYSLSNAIAGIDKTAPDAPLTLDLNASDDTGVSSTDNLTKNTSALTISGTAEAGSTVKIYDTDGTTLLGTGTATGGNFSIDVALTASATPHSLTAKATDSANNTSVGSSALAITVDATAPTFVSAQTKTTTTIQVVFSEALNGNAIADFGIGANVKNNNLDASSESPAGTITFTLTTPITTGETPVVYYNSIWSSGVLDDAGNEMITAQITPTDGIKPTVTISDDEPSTANIAGGDVVFTFTFSESVTGFDATDVVVTGGAKGTFAGSGALYTLDVTPTPNSTANITVNVAAGVSADSAGNTNTVAIQSTQAVDTLASVIEITNPTTAKAQTKTVTAIVDNGTLEMIVDSATCDAGTAGTFVAYSSTTFSAEADNGKKICYRATDTAGNIAYSLSDAIAGIDTTAPTVVSIAVADSALKATETSGVLITFSEAVTNFANADLTIENGSLTAVASSDGGTTWTATFEPTADLEDATNAISLDAANVTDIAGNAGATAVTNSNNYAIDTKYAAISSVAVASNNTNTAWAKAGDTVTYTISYSENVTVAIVSATTANNITTAVTTDAHANASSSDTIVFTVASPNTGAITPNAVSFKITDASGNETTISSLGTITGSVTADTTAPTGTVGYSTSAPTNVDVVSTLTPSDTNTVTVTNNGGILTKTFSANGTFEFQFSDIAGNTGIATATVANIDKSTPDAPTGLDLAAADDTNINTDNTTSTTTALTISGTAEIDSTVELFDGATSLGTVVADHTTGAFTKDVSLAAGTHSITAKATDAANNTSIASTALSIVVDTTAPAVPTADKTTGNYNAAQTVTITPASGANKTYYTLDGSAPTSSSTEYTVPVLVDGVDTATTTLKAISYDLAGNAGTLLSEAFSFDKTSPTVAITDDEDATANIANGDVIFTFTFSEAVTGFDATDITVVGGSKGIFTATSATVYTLAVTPTTNSTANITVDVAAGAAQDAVTNLSVVATQAVQAVDTVAPTATVAFTSSALKKGETTVLTATFSEVPTGFVEADDLVVQNGTLSGGAFDGTGKIYTATFTPTDDLEDATNVATLATTWTDAAGNAPVASTVSVNYVVETKLPTVISVSYADAALKAGETTLVTIVFSEAVAATPTVAMPNGTLGTLATADAGITWTGTFTPTVDTEDATNVAVINPFADIAGNAGISYASTTNYAVETKLPTATPVAILSNNATPTLAKEGNEITVSFTTSETVALPTATIAGKTATVAIVSGNQYTAKYTLTATETQGAAAIAINFVDTAGNAATPVVATTNASAVTIDTTAMTVAETTPSQTPTANVTPSFVITPTENGTFTLSGTGCVLYSSVTNVLVANTQKIVTLGPLPYGTYNCSIVATDTAGNVTTKALSELVVSTSSSTSSSSGGGGGGGGSSSYKAPTTTTPTTTTTPETTPTTTPTTTENPNIVIINGEQVDVSTLTPKERRELFYQNTETTSPTTTTPVSITPSSFVDTQTHWAKDVIEMLKEKGVVRATEEFRPDASINRAEVVKMAVEAFAIKKDTSDAAVFQDVPQTEWYFESVISAKNAGIISVKSNFAPGKEITRAEALKIALLASNRQILSGNPEFADVKTGDWYNDYLYTAKSLGIVNGKADGNFYPDDAITRAEFAKILSLLLK